jgi:uncharacterized repeat protein (TIGR03803 family)
VAALVGCISPIGTANWLRSAANARNPRSSLNYRLDRRPAVAILVQRQQPFGTTYQGGAGYGTVFEVPKSASRYATTATILVSFGVISTDGAGPKAGLIADANGNLFGTTSAGGASGQGTVFKLAKTASGYANAPTILASFCALTGCTDGSQPQAGLIPDANGNLFGTTEFGGAIANSVGTVFEVTGSGFVVPAIFTGTPGRPNWHPCLRQIKMSRSLPSEMSPRCGCGRTGAGAEPQRSAAPAPVGCADAACISA